MSLAPKNKNQQGINWRPSASLSMLRIRAQLLAKIREFFADRQVLEVETPLLCHTSVTDPFIESIPAQLRNAGGCMQTYYLQTSPEYAMKRLLAAGSGAIYQITKAFRQAEIGRFHNPEFSMIEWYRTGFDHHALMDDMDDFLKATINAPQALRVSYRELFMTILNIDPLNTHVFELKQLAQQKKLEVVSDITDIDSWLHLLMSHCIEPELGHEEPCFVYDFPASQAALARLVPSEHGEVAARFEVYMKGIELANGFYELQSAFEQRKRFEKNLLERQQLNLASLPLDEYFLNALEHGLPDCAGVALGVDRLLMIATQCDHIAEIMSFDISRA